MWEISPNGVGLALASQISTNMKLRLSIFLFNGFHPENWVWKYFYIFGFSRIVIGICSRAGPNWGAHAKIALPLLHFTPKKKKCLERYQYFSVCNPQPLELVRVVGNRLLWKLASNHIDWLLINYNVRKHFIRSMFRHEFKAHLWPCKPDQTKLPYERNRQIFILFLCISSRQ